jgi:hypothetical protein
MGAAAAAHVSGERSIEAAVAILQPLLAGVRSPPGGH